MTGSRPARRRRHGRRPAPRHVVGAILVAIAALSLVAAFLMYRSSLERPDSFSQRIARNAPDRLPVRQIALRHPDSAGEGMVWTTTDVSARSDHPTVLGKLVASEWATRIAERCAIPSPGPPVAHFFYDERRIAYIDFDPAFLKGCTTGTMGEVELMDALEQTIRANLPGTAAIVVMSGGIPLVSTGHHLALEYGR